MAADDTVWVTGDVHIAPQDEARAELFVDFLSQARSQATRLLVLGDLFDYWIGPRHGRRCAYAPVIAAFEQARADGFPVDFIAGNRDFLGPRELESVGLTLWGDAVVLDREGQRTVVTHGDLLVQGDLSYKRYRRWVRSWWFRLGYDLVPVWFRLAVALWLRGASERKLAKVTPFDFPIDLQTSLTWQRDLGAEALLMGHLHREERHEHDGALTCMLPGWHGGRASYFALDPGQGPQLRFYEG